MTNYVSLLNNDEFLCICRIITARQLRELFRMNPQKFNRIKGGYNFKKSTDEETFSFTARNKDEDFICGFVNTWIHTRLDEIREYKENLIASGMQSEEAWIETLSKSLFSDMVDLYLTFSEDDCIKECPAIIAHAVALKRRLENAEAAKENAEKNIEHAEEKLKALQQEYENTIVEFKAKCDDLERSCAFIKEENARLNNELKNAQSELLQYRNLAKHAILEEEYYPAPGYTVLSLCYTYSDDRGRDRLLRCADITEEGEISNTFAENAPPYRHLYQNDGPRKKGDYGIWDWTAIPNENDPSKDFLKASFNSKYIPILVHIVNDCSSISDLIEQLKLGIPLTVTSPRLMLSFFNGAVYEGLFCTAESLEESAGKIYLKQNVTALAEFVFTNNDVVHIEGISFLRFLNTGLPTRVVKVKNPIEITRDIVLQRVTWSVYKQKGFLKNEFRQFKDFVAELPVEDLWGEISSTCDCSQEEAKAYLHDLISEAETILDGTYPESEVMAQIIRNDDALIKECQDELRQEWEERNKALLDTANDELSKIKAEEAELRTSLEMKRAECSSLDARYTAIQEQIQKKQQLAADVEKEVATRIDQARNDAARFIADNAFIRPLTIESNESNFIPKQHVLSCFVDGQYREDSELEINNDWHELLDTIQTELLEAGVAEEKALGLAGVLYAAFINRTPVLLAGPNSREISNAFSLALYGCTPAVLHCTGDINADDLQKCQESSADVVVIENPFEHSWYSSILEMLSHGRRFYMLVNPFAEDLTIEPKGLLNYCLPLLTEYYIGSQPRSQYIGGRMAEAFQAFERSPVDDRRCYGALLRKMQMSPFSVKRVQRILADFDALLPSKEENDYAFVLNPVAYVLGMTDTLDEYRREHAKEQLVGVQ